MESLDEWMSFWLDNPMWRRLGKDWPIGWVLEIPTGEIVGSLVNIPSLYKFRGSELVCSSGRAWAVKPAYRGYAIWLIDEYFSQRGTDLFIDTGVGPNSLTTFDRLASRIPVGDWGTYSYWLVGRTRLVERKFRRLRVPLPWLLAYPAGGALLLKDAICVQPLPKSPKSFQIETAQYFDSRFDMFWSELTRENSETLLKERSSRTLSWHFGRRMAKGQLWICTATRNRRLRAYCTLVCKRNFNSVQLIDYQTVEPEVDLLPGLLRAVLDRCSKEDLYYLENYGRGVPKMRTLDVCAPYSKKLPSWRAFYRASNSALDSELREARFWDPSFYDGDASLA
jgi:hypothetical protein